MGNGASKVTSNKLSELQDEIKQQRELFALLQQQQMMQNSADVWKRAEETLKKAEDMARAQQDAMRRMEESTRRADEIRDSMRRLEEEMLRANEERARAEADAYEREQDAKRAQEDAERAVASARTATQEAEKQLREGAPIVVPTQAQRDSMRRKFSYQEGLFHFAVAGVSGSGKSSLINALRGLRNKDKGAAPTGVVETTARITRYPGPSSGMPYVWYDVPGAGTLTVPDWQYFTEQGLYVLDCIIVVFDNRFTAVDIAILRNSARFQIPTFIVRSKSSQHIRNLADDMDEDDEEENEEDLRLRMETARSRYIRDTSEIVERGLEEAGLAHQRVYIIDKNALVKVVNGRAPAGCIDEVELLQDMLDLATLEGDVSGSAEGSEKTLG
ncbi:P-loop containing nucleoside triphosphate hydrolase protein [Daedalea quercina L-15889]|uniref:p-loop containing nucleoside triphosphate hydrolase protein n=1 Tax=Daedalea quercina L-15889 TaxID=1314783 RepID=A0A165QST3_9APHY|nr:P-loop containing nucleoside triphosphate hydrolase protein [Daedalea quercina L-15889]